MRVRTSGYYFQLERLFLSSVILDNHAYTLDTLDGMVGASTARWVPRWHGGYPGGKKKSTCASIQGSPSRCDVVTRHAWFYVQYIMYIVYCILYIIHCVVHIINISHCTAHNLVSNVKCWVGFVSMLSK